MSEGSREMLDMRANIEEEMARNREIKRRILSKSAWYKRWRRAV